MVKPGTLPHYLYTAKVSEVAETTEEYSIPLIVPIDVSTAVVNEKEVAIKEVQEDEMKSQMSLNPQATRKRS